MFGLTGGFDGWYKMFGEVFGDVTLELGGETGPLMVGSCAGGRKGGKLILAEGLLNGMKEVGSFPKGRGLVLCWLD